MKICTKCKEEKSESDFSWKIKGIRRCTACKTCYGILTKKHYLLNKQLIISRNAARVKERKRKILEYLMSHPCTRCGEENPVWLEFHHLDPREKEREISNLIGFAWSTIKKEIDKCIVLCSKCHKLRTALDRGWFERHKDVLGKFSVPPQW